MSKFKVGDKVICYRVNPRQNATGMYNHLVGKKGKIEKIDDEICEDYGRDYLIKFDTISELHMYDYELKLQMIPFNKLSRKMYPNAKIVEENNKKYLQL